MASLRAALARLVTVEEAVAITDPITTAIAKAWKVAPPGTKGLPETPACVNIPTLVSVDRRVGLRIRRYQVRIQVFAGPALANTDRMADVALALIEQLIDDLDSDVQLNGEVTNTAIGGNTLVVGVLEFGGLAYIGGEVLLDIEIKDGRTFSA